MIKKIKWNNHNVLGNLELDFSKADGSIYNTIILAGENGTGKTTILETLATFLNLGSIEPFEYINYNINDVSYNIYHLKDDYGAELGFHQRKNENENTTKEIRTNRNNSPDSIKKDYEDIRHYGFAYSKARSGFKTQLVKSSTTDQQLDLDKYENDNKEDFTSIKQLLVNISTQDNADWMKISKSGTKKVFEDFKKDSKVYRFENAFNNFFEKVKFKEVDPSNPNEIKVIFEKYGKDICIDELSTGEKQIVFRGAHLLKNLNSISDGIVLIDEPELSMHPKWQEKILQYYRNLFTKDGKQNVQIIIATHSEYVLQSALEDRDDVLIIALNDNNGTIESKNITAPIILPTITVAETNYLAFGIISPDYHIELYGYLQNRIHTTSVKDCDDYIMNQTTLFNPTLHTKIYQHGSIQYQTLPTYIRNSIDHPSPTYTYTKEELKRSIELLIKLCR